MIKLLGMKKSAVLFELFNDQGVGVPDGFAAQELGHAVVIPPIGKNWIVNLEVITQTSLIVLSTVAWGGVNEAGAVFEGDVVGEDDGLDARFIKRVVIFNLLSNYAARNSAGNGTYALLTE